MKEGYDFKIRPLGESAIVVDFGSDINIDIHNKVRALSAYLQEHPFTGMIETIPAYTTVTILYDPFNSHNGIEIGKVYR